jgi:CheY-like chemotaxis protein
MMRADMIGQSVGNSWSSEAHLLLSETTTVIPRSILLFGKDAMLLQTRRWLLERSGYVVRTASDLTELDRMSAEGPVDLLILCHSLSVEEAALAEAVVSSRYARVKILALVIGTSRRGDALHAATVATNEGPAGLLLRVESLTSG